MGKEARRYASGALFELDQEVRQKAKLAAESAAVAAALLIARGAADNAKAAEALMRQSRRGVRLHRIQKRTVDAVTRLRQHP